MAVTIKAIREKKEKSLNKSLKKQESNAKIVAKRIKRIKRDLLNLQIDRLKDEEWLTKLTWEYVGYIGHYEAYAIRAKEDINKHDIAGKVMSWYYDNKEEKNDYLELKRDGKRIVCMTQQSIDVDTWDEWRVVIFAVEIDNWGNESKEISDKMLKAFVEKFGIKVDINEEKK